MATRSAGARRQCTEGPGLRLQTEPPCMASCTCTADRRQTPDPPRPAPLPLATRELHDKYVRLGERMEALVKEGKVLKSSASAEAGAARTAVQVRRRCMGRRQRKGGRGAGRVLLKPRPQRRPQFQPLPARANVQEALRDADAEVKERAALVARVRDLQVPAAGGIAGNTCAVAAAAGAAACLLLCGAAQQPAGDAAGWLSLHSWPCRHAALYPLRRPSWRRSRRGAARSRTRCSASWRGPSRR